MNDDTLALITAAVDGELSPREAARLRVQLDGSAEARAVYERLTADSTRLSKLPRVRPPADLHSRVVAAVAGMTPPPPVRVPKNEPAPARKPAREPRRTSPRTSPRTFPWVPVAVAASLLLVVSSSSFWFFTRNSEPQAEARNPNRPPLATHTGASDPAWAKWLPSESGPRPSAPTPRENSHHTIVQNEPATPVPQPAEHDAVAQAPDPRPIRSPLVGFPVGPETPPFDLVDVRIPFLKPLGDFDRDEVRQQFATELGRDPAFRIDLFARDSNRAVQLFQAAAKAAGVTVHADAATVNAINKRQPGPAPSVVVYSESLSALELVDLFAKLSAEDAKISPRVFDALHATPASNTDGNHLRDVLGTDPGLFNRLLAAPEKNADVGPASGKPISAGTADEIVKSITTGQNKPSIKSAVVMTWLPTNSRTSPASSAELKQFLGKRGERKPTAVPVFIVIRHGNG